MWFQCFCVSSCLCKYIYIYIFSSWGCHNTDRYKLTYTTTLAKHTQTHLSRGLSPAGGGLLPNLQAGWLYSYSSHTQWLELTAHTYTHAHTHTAGGRKKSTGEYINISSATCYPKNFITRNYFAASSALCCLFLLFYLQRIFPLYITKKKGEGHWEKGNRGRMWTRRESHN